MILKDKILIQFAKEGIFENEKIKIPSTLLWSPNLILKKGAKNYFVLFRSSNTVLPAFLNRIAKTPSTYGAIIIFEKKCSKSEENNIISQGVSIGYFINNKLSLLLQTSKKIVAKETRKKLSIIDIFISSKQDIEERGFIAERIEALRKIHSYPFNVPHQIEYHKFDLKKLKEYINSEIDKCEWIVIILEDNHSSVVSYEIKRAIKLLDHDNIFMFVKSTKQCHTSWEKELDYIKKMETQSVKYLPYTSMNDLEITLSKAIGVRMGDIYKKHKIKIVE